MKRFHRKRPVRRHLGLQRRSSRVLEKARREWPARRIQNLEAHWAALQQGCLDLGSRTRLTRLLDRLTGADPGGKESAIAELELAIQLIRAGCTVGFLRESQSKTVDLECCVESHRFFLEVTALPGSPRQRNYPPAASSSLLALRRGYDEDEPDPAGLDLTDRLVARMAKKAPQLVGYVEPVVLAMTVPHRDRLRAGQTLPIDLKRMTGTLTLMLAKWRHISAVLLSLWDVEPLPTRSGVRLSNVFSIERSAQQKACPRVRMLILNPAGEDPLNEAEIAALRSIL